MGERLPTAKGKYEPKLEFPDEKGEGALKPKNPPWEGVRIFPKTTHIQTK